MSGATSSKKVVLAIHAALPVDLRGQHRRLHSSWDSDMVIALSTLAAS
jgi:hypothetical protein